MLVVCSLASRATHWVTAAISSNFTAFCNDKFDDCGKSTCEWSLADGGESDWTQHCCLLAADFGGGLAIEPAGDAHHSQGEAATSPPLSCCSTWPLSLWCYLTSDSDRNCQRVYTRQHGHCKMHHLSFWSDTIMMSICTGFNRFLILLQATVLCEDCRIVVVLSAVWFLWVVAAFLLYFHPSGHIHVAFTVSTHQQLQLDLIVFFRTSSLLLCYWSTMWWVVINVQRNIGAIYYIVRRRRKWKWMWFLSYWCL